MCSFGSPSCNGLKGVSGLEPTRDKLWVSLSPNQLIDLIGTRQGVLLCLSLVGPEPGLLFSARRAARG